MPCKINTFRCLCQYFTIEKSRQYADKGCRGGVFDGDTHYVSHAVVAPGEDKGLVLLVATDELLAGAFGDTLDEDFERLADVTAVGCERQFVLQRYHSVKAVYFDFFGDVVGHCA